MAGILLVEDDGDLRTMLRSFLEKKRYVVMEAENGREAINKFKPLLTDLLITDLLMPEQDGIGLIMEIKKIKPDIKVLAISGGGKAGPSNYLSIASTLGAEVVLAKPFSLNLFLEKVELLIG